MKEPVFNFIIGAVIAGSIVALIVFGIEYPRVVISHSTGECVYADPPYSCDDLPQKYALVWAE